MKKPTVGHIVFIKQRGCTTTDTPVVRVGRKYFYVNPLRHVCTEQKYNIDNWASADGVWPQNQAYESQQAIFDDTEIEKLCLKIREWFDKGRFLPLENLREIDKMMEREGEQK